MGFQKIKPTEVSENFLDLLQRNNSLLTAGDKNELNMMVVSSGAIGDFFRRPVLYVYVRPGRYTRTLMDKSDYFTLSFYGEAQKDQVSFCARSSGRDTDKVKETGLTPAFADCGAPYFEEASLVYVCRKIYVEKTDPALFLDPSLDEWFPQKDYHIVYMGEILEVLQKE